MHAISYGHVRAGIFYRGTISDMDGYPRATWTFEENGQDVTRDQPIDQAGFDRLWNGFADLRITDKYHISDPNREIDPLGYHIIQVIFQQASQQGRHLFLIPKGESDPAFVQWLGWLNVPGSGPAAPSLSPDDLFAPIATPAAAPQKPAPKAAAQSAPQPAAKPAVQAAPDKPGIEARVLKQARNFLMASLPYVDGDALEASGDRKVVLLLFVYGTIKAFEKPASLTSQQIDSVFRNLIEEVFGWPLKPGDSIMTLMHDTLRPGGDAELREHMVQGKKAIAAFKGQPDEDAARRLAGILDQYVAE